MRSIWLALCRFVSWLFLLTGIYQAWSRVYRFVWERAYRDVPLRVYALDALSEVLSKNAAKYIADGPRQLWDAISEPAKAQAVFDGLFVPPDGLDCEDFAIFSVCTLQKGIIFGVVPASVNPLMLTVVWLDGWSQTGHSVCLLRVGSGYGYIDYGSVKGHAQTVNEVALNVIKEYAPKADLVTWMVSGGDLTCLEVHRV